MELVMLGSNAFAHIVEALILWISMSQMYEPKYKQNQEQRKIVVFLT